MSHTLAFASGSTVRIYVNQEGWEESVSALTVEHNVLDATNSVFQYMGAKSPAMPLRFIVVGWGNYEYLKGKFRDGYEFVYTNDLGASGSYICPSFRGKRIQAINQSEAWYDCQGEFRQLAGSGSLHYQWTAP